MTEEASPDPLTAQTTSGPVPTTDNEKGAGAWLQAIYAVSLIVLLVANVVLYSLHQGVHSRVESQEHRIERLNTMLTDMLASSANAEKIEKIEQKITGIETSIDDLNAMLKQSLKAPPPDPPAKGKR